MCHYFLFLTAKTQLVEIEAAVVLASCNLRENKFRKQWKKNSKGAALSMKISQHNPTVAFGELVLLFMRSHPRNRWCHCLWNLWWKECQRGRHKWWMTQVECFTLCKPRKPIVIGLSLNPGQKLFDPNRPTFGPDDLGLPISSSEFSTLQLLVIVLLIHCHSTSHMSCNIHCAYSWFLSYSYGIWCICIGRNISYIIYHRTLYIFLVIFIGSDAYIGDHVCSIFWAIYFGGHQSPTDIVQQMDFNLEITFVSIKKSSKRNRIF